MEVYELKNKRPFINHPPLAVTFHFFHKKITIFDNDE